MPGQTLRGSLQVPGDKSVSHRAIMLGSLADGDTEIHGPEGGRVWVRGVGLHGLKAPAGPLDMGNAGTAMRLLCGILAGQCFDSTLVGDASLSRRPMRRVTEPLTAMGARIDTTETGTAPLGIHGGQRLRGIEYPLPVASAQIKSCLLLAGLYAGGRTVIHEPGPSRDHTERMLAALGYELERDGPRVALGGGGRLRGALLEVPADISSAAFFLVGASITEGAELTLTGVGINPTRTGVIDILRLMGADLTLGNERLAGGEPVADIRVRAAPLHGIEIPEALVPLAIDEFPALFIAAACAEGETRLGGARELRVKETDRIQVMAEGLQALGVDARPTEDGMVIRGGPLRGGRVDSAGDHRIAMAFAMAALRATGPVEIDDCANVATSFPDFPGLAGSVGLHVEVSGE
jgi:3-phosphoshikimate 1-carboxyvinyltransferase